MKTQECGKTTDFKKEYFSESNLLVELFRVLLQTCQETPSSEENCQLASA